MMLSILSGCYDGFIYCLNLKSGEIFWKVKTNDAVKCPAVISDDGRVIVGSYDQHVYCFSEKVSVCVCVWPQ